MAHWSYLAGESFLLFTYVMHARMHDYTTTRRHDGYARNHWGVRFRGLRGWLGRSSGGFGVLGVMAFWLRQTLTHFADLIPSQSLRILSP
ncbi:hypothetical protein F4808DRAFT_436661 [Astrocystis sublimbata]|nr:hypothetical protein F4808DRAFT_436661 [Astrocystis sublimbata]